MKRKIEGVGLRMLVTIVAAYWMVHCIVAAVRWHNLVFGAFALCFIFGYLTVWRKISDLYDKGRGGK